MSSAVCVQASPAGWRWSGTRRGVSLPYREEPVLWYFITFKSNLKPKILSYEDSFPIAVCPTAPTCSSYSEGALFSQYHLPCAAGIPNSSMGTHWKRQPLLLWGWWINQGTLFPKAFIPQQRKWSHCFAKMFCGWLQASPPAQRRVPSYDDISGSVIALGAAGKSPRPPHCQQPCCHCPSIPAKEVWG